MDPDRTVQHDLSGPDSHCYIQCAVKRVFLVFLYLDCCPLPVFVIINPYCLPLPIAMLVHLIFICIVSFLTIVMKVFAAVKCIASLCLFLNDPASDGAVNSQQIQCVPLYVR